MTDDPSASSGQAMPARGADIARRLEAILLIVDEPQSLVALAAAVGSP
ncbi:MAG TPA: SMC-Scp complex subunit ScpB, partial [Microbacterium sp.]|nr:SMC-Scp complex subunit ScpB [Microbacterium sp.]